MSPGWWVLLAAVVLAVALGLLKRWRDDRFRPAGDEGVLRLTSQDLRATLGERATLVLFSSAFCAPCRATRVLLGQVADQVDGVRNVEIDAESHLDLVRRVGVLRTPTTFVLDERGRVLARASGVPRREQVLAALPS